MRIDPGKNHGIRECANCGVDVPANNNRCPICQYEFPNRTPMGRVKLLAAIVLLLLLLLPFFF